MISIARWNAIAVLAASGGGQAHRPRQKPGRSRACTQRASVERAVRGAQASRFEAFYAHPLTARRPFHVLVLAALRRSIIAGVGLRRVLVVLFLQRAPLERLTGACPLTTGPAAGVRRAEAASIPPLTLLD